MRHILSRLRSAWNELQSGGTALVSSLADGVGTDGRSVDLYECSACQSVFIEPPSESCSQCRTGTLEKV